MKHAFCVIIVHVNPSSMNIFPVTSYEGRKSICFYFSQDTGIQTDLHVQLSIQLMCSVKALCHYTAFGTSLLIFYLTEVMVDTISDKKIHFLPRNLNQVGAPFK